MWITLRAHLCGQHDEGHADHDDHEELRGPDVRHVVAVPHGGEGDDDVVHGLEQVEVAVPGALEVLDAAHAGGRGGVME